MLHNPHAQKQFLNLGRDSKDFAILQDNVTALKLQSSSTLKKLVKLSGILVFNNKDELQIAHKNLIENYCVWLVRNLQILDSYVIVKYFGSYADHF